MLIFLDIDGVMVPAKSWQRPELLGDGFPAFSNKASIALQHVISEDTIVILTTSHKASYSIEGWKTLFATRGIYIKNISSLSTNSNQICKTRKDEILNWFNENNIYDDFVIIDDDKSLNSLPQNLKEHLVQTSSFIGLTEEHIQLIEAKKKNTLRVA